jgi:hypothetical protein
MSTELSRYYLQDFRTSIAALVSSEWSPQWIACIPIIAQQGMREGYDNPLLWALAGEETGANSFELEADFKRALSQLGITLPTFKQAVEMMLSYYCQRAVSQPSDVIAIIHELIYEVVHTHSEEQLQENFGKVSKYAHDNLGSAIASLYGLYYEYDELDYMSEVLPAQKIASGKVEIEAAMITQCKKYLLEAKKKGVI